MSYPSDPVFQTVQWLRGRTNDGPAFPDAFAAAWRDWAGTPPRNVEIRLGFTNYKPFERARIVAEAAVSSCNGAGVAEQTRLSLFLHVFADPQAARAEFDKGLSGPPHLCDVQPPFCLPSRGLVVWTLPNAPNLRQLHRVMDPAGFRSMLPSPSAPEDLPASADAPALHRYVPLHRAVLTWNRASDGERFFVKIIACGAKANAAALNLRELHARGAHGEFSFSVPRPVRYSPDQQTLIMTEVPGRPFTDVIDELRPLPFERLGDALAELHGIPATPTAKWSLDKQLADLRRHMRGARRALPHLSRRLEAVLDGLEQRAGQLPAVPRTPLHGNLFGDQVLYDDASSNPIGIVDWDDWCHGDPHFDLGRLVAHVLYIAELRDLPDRAVGDCIAALLARYARTAGRTIYWPWFEWHVATALLQRAKISSLRQLADGWPGHFDFVVSAVEAYLRDERPSPTWRGGEVGALAGLVA